MKVSINDDSTSVLLIHFGNESGTTSSQAYRMCNIEEVRLDLVAWQLQLKLKDNPVPAVANIKAMPKDKSTLDMLCKLEKAGFISRASVEAIAHECVLPLGDIL